MTREPLPASAFADAIYSTLDRSCRWKVRVVEAFDVALTLIRDLVATYVTGDLPS